MNEQTQENPSTLVPVKRVRLESGKGKNGDQEQIVLTFGLDKEGKNGLQAFVKFLQDILNAGDQKQANVDIRITEKQSERGTKFPSAFVLVREMIPRDAGGGFGGKATYTKKPTNQDKIKAQANKFKNGVE